MAVSIFLMMMVLPWLSCVCGWWERGVGGRSKQTGWLTTKDVLLCYREEGITVWDRLKIRRDESREWFPVLHRKHQSIYNIRDKRSNNFVCGSHNLQTTDLSFRCSISRWRIDLHINQAEWFYFQGMNQAEVVILISLANILYIIDLCISCILNIHGKMYRADKE